MDYREEYNESFEPVVIINDESDDEFQEQHDPLALDEEETYKSPEKTTDELIKSIGPEVSIIPVKKKPRPVIKIRLFAKEYSPSKDDVKVQSEIRPVLSNRSPLIKISEEEAKVAAELYSKRKSSPLKRCPLCKKYFRRMETHLLQHEGVVNTEELFTCEVCFKNFKDMSNLQIHLKGHTAERPYVCTVCDKSFTQSCNLTNHMRIHTGEKPFKCPHCDKAFTQSGNLNNHIRLHTDEKPFKCHFCNKAFVQSGNLNSHIKNNHKFQEAMTESMDHFMGQPS